MVGKTISHYRVLDRLGEGGMGVVYKARDTHLDRFVAVKVLRPDRVNDPERKRRFVQEAKAASALNHPNIVTVHDIDQRDGVDYIVMEYVVGKPLSELIPRKGMRLNEALKLAVQMADAVAAAHEAGIVHRDLKPGNVVVSEKGQVKVVDFGLAKLTEAGPRPDAETVTTPLTGENTIVGSVNYMSPEQAQGLKVEARSDIFSFGAVLYEMVTGRRAFQGDSKMSALGAIIHKEPEPLGPEVPHDLEKIITRCLRKDADRRYQHMDDVKIALEELKEQSDSGGLVTAAAPGVRSGQLRRRLGLAGALAVVAAALATLWLAVILKQEPPAALTAVPLTSYPGWECCPSFSPDGSQIAFVWNGEKQDNYDIYVQVIGSGEPLRLTTDPAEDRDPAWSPDGRFIAFLRVGRQKTSLLVIPPLGGVERTLAEYDDLPPTEGSGLVWTPDGKWLAYPEKADPRESSSLTLLSPTTGEKRGLTTPLGGGIYGDAMPAFSPDGRTLAFVRRVSGGPGDLYLLALSGDMAPKGQPQRLTFENQYVRNPVWTGDGREVLYSSGSLVSRSLRRISPEGLLSGRLAGAPKGEQMMFPGDIADTPALSPPRRRMVFARSAYDTNIWRVDLTAAGEPAGSRPFIASTRWEGNPQFSPDGKQIVFISDRSGSPEVWKCDPDGSNPEQLTFLGAGTTGCPRWSPDGQRIVFDSNAEGQFRLYVMSAQGGSPRRLGNGKADDAVASWSRCGQFIYFVSNRTGRWQIWKMSASDESAVQVTQDGGHVAFESYDGKFIYYSGPDEFSPVYKMPVGGGTETKMIEAVRPFSVAVAMEGLYYITPPDLDGNSMIEFLDFASGKTKSLVTISKPVEVGLAVSPDNRTILYAQVDQLGSDLMLVENFR